MKHFPVIILLDQIFCMSLKHLFLKKYDFWLQFWHVKELGSHAHPHKKKKQTNRKTMSLDTAHTTLKKFTHNGW